MAGGRRGQQQDVEPTALPRGPCLDCAGFHFKLLYIKKKKKSLVSASLVGTESIIKANF